MKDYNISKSGHKAYDNKIKKGYPEQYAGPDVDKMCKNLSKIGLFNNIFLISLVNSLRRKRHE